MSNVEHHSGLYRQRITGGHNAHRYQDGIVDPVDVKVNARKTFLEADLGILEDFRGGGTDHLADVVDTSVHVRYVEPRKKAS